MASVTVFLFLACLAITIKAQLDPLAKVELPIELTPVDYLRSHIIQPYAINGAKDCGVVRRVTQFTHNNCAPALPAVPCVGEVNKPTDAHVYFIAGEDASDIIARVSIVTSDGQVKSVSVPVPNSSIKTGQSYALRVSGMVEEELMGRLFTARIEVLKESDMSVQACAEADFLGYKA